MYLRFQAQGWLWSRDLIHYWQSNLLGNEQRWSSGGERRAVIVCLGPWEYVRRQNEQAHSSYSLLTAWHKTKWLTWQMHDAGILDAFAHWHTNTCESIHKHVCSLSETHNCTHICVCAHSCNTKLALSYSQAVETDLTQCVHCLMRGGEERKRCSTVQCRDLPSVENQWRKISVCRDAAVEQVHLLHACSTIIEQLHNLNRNHWRTESTAGAEEMKGLLPFI